MKNKNIDLEAVREMVLVIENDGSLFEKYLNPIMNTLAKKVKKGTFEKEKAFKILDNCVKVACIDYTKNYGTSKYYETFNKATREQIAKDLIDGMIEQIKEIAETK